MYIENELLTGMNGTLTQFTLSNSYKAGSLLISYNGKLFYEFREVKGSGNEAKIEIDFAPLATDVIKVSYYTINEPNVQNALRYVTVRQIQSLSRVADLLAATDADNEKLIREAEGYIDVLCGGWARYYEIQGSSTEHKGQIHVFPRIEDDNTDDTLANTAYPSIPSQITQAAMYAVENLFLMGNPSTADLGEETIESEKLGDYSYKKTSKTSATDAVEMARSMLGSRATSLLRGYTKNFGEIAIRENKVDRPESWLNSRQRFVNNNM